MKPARRKRRWFLRLAAGALFTLLVGATGLWLLFQHIPAWYRPIHVPAQRHQAVRNDLTLMLNDLSARMADGVPFDFTVTQGQLNEWLAARTRIWPGVRRWVPPWLDEPMVIFQQDRIVLAGIATARRSSSLRTVISLHLSLAAEAHGLRVTLHRLQAGSLPAPLGPLRARVESALSDAQADRRAENRITTAHLFGEDTFPNEFVWFNGKVPFRITAVTTEPGQIRLRFEPKPRKPHAGRRREGEAPAEPRGGIAPRRGSHRSENPFSDPLPQESFPARGRPRSQHQAREFLGARHAHPRLRRVRAWHTATSPQIGAESRTHL